MSLRGIIGDLMLSIKKFEDWLTKSRKGNKITYYRGYIMAPHLQKFSPTTDERRVNSIKKRVQNAYDHGLVTLVQKRHGDLDYEYIAIRKNALTPKEVEKVRIGALAKVINGVSK